MPKIGTLTLEKAQSLSLVGSGMQRKKNTNPGTSAQFNSLYNTSGYEVVSIHAAVFI